MRGEILHPSVGKKKGKYDHDAAADERDQGIVQSGRGTLPRKNVEMTGEELGKNWVLCRIIIADDGDLPTADEEKKICTPANALVKYLNGNRK